MSPNKNEKTAGFNACGFCIEMRKEVGVTQQYPVKENDVVDLHGVEHGEKPHKEVQEAEAVSDAVPYA